MERADRADGQLTLRFTLRGRLRRFAVTSLRTCGGALARFPRCALTPATHHAPVCYPPATHYGKNQKVHPP